MRANALTTTNRASLHQDQTLRALTVATLVAASSAVVIGTPGVADAAATGIYKNCTAFHTKYKHGVGKAGAHYHTSGTPVTNFYRSTSVYKTAIKKHSDLDRDKDGVACEKR